MNRAGTRIRAGLYLIVLIELCAVGAAWSAYEVAPVTDGGAVRGRVTWKGDIPQLPPLRVFADMDICGSEVPSTALRVDPSTSGVQSVLVYIEKITRGKAPAPVYRLEMGQPPDGPAPDRCAFRQHVFPFVRAADLALINFDPILHNPHFFQGRASSLFNIAMPTPDREVKVKLPRANGPGIRVVCDVHVHMNAWAAAFEHPYFAVTDEQGRFEIPDIPPGTYRLVAWHEGYNITHFASSRPVYDEPHVATATVRITSGAVTEADFQFPVREVTVDWRIAGESTAAD